MGEQYVTPPVVSLDSVFDQSTPFSPIVFILSPGADPAGELGKLAEIKGYGGNRFKFLAMGQGQEKVSPLLFWVGGIEREIAVIFPPPSACPATFGDCFHTWTLVDVAELPSVDPMAAAAGKGLGENDQTSSWLQTVAHNWTHFRISHWHTAGNQWCPVLKDFLYISSIFIPEIT